MIYLALFDDIKALSEQAYLLASQGDFEQCPDVLVRRQLLLEQLHNELIENQLLQTSSIKTDYILFLETLQEQDNSAQLLLKKERKEMQQFFQKQPAIRKAINAYHNVQINQ